MTGRAATRPAESWPGVGWSCSRCIAVLLGAVYLRGSGRWGGDPQVYADVTNAGGSLRSGSDVKLRGRHRRPGHRRSTGRPTARVRVAMRLPQESLRQVPGDVVARILPATVFGTSFVDLVPPKNARGRPRSGPAPWSRPTPRPTPSSSSRRSTTSTRWSRRSAPPSWPPPSGPPRWRCTTAATSSGRTAEVLDAYLRKLNPAMPLVRSDLRKLADGLEVVREVAPDLLQATDDGLVTARTIVDEQAAIEAILQGAPASPATPTRSSAPTATTWPGSSTTPTGCSTRSTTTAEVGFTGAILTNIQVAAVVASAVKDGAMQTDAVFRFDAPPYYGPGDRPSYGRHAMTGLRPDRGQVRRRSRWPPCCCSSCWSTP